LCRGAFLALVALAGCQVRNPAFELNAGADAPARADAAATPVDAPAAIDLAEDAPAPVDLAGDAPAPVDLAEDAPAPVDLAAVPEVEPELPAEPAPLTGPDLLTGLVGYWPMDDGAGGIARDRSKYGHDGALEDLDPAAAWVSGHIGSALYVSAIANAGISVRRTDALDRIQHFTLAAWVYREEVPRFASILSREIPGTNADVYGLTFSNDELSIYLPPSPGLTTVLRSRTPFPVRQWVHTAATYDGNTLILYQGGEWQGSLPVQVSLPASTAPLYLGTNKNSTQAPEPLHGRLDEVLLYERALLPSEIAALAGGMRPPVGN
jgi:hypothetical protein